MISSVVIENLKESYEEKISRAEKVARIKEEENEELKQELNDAKFQNNVLKSKLDVFKKDLINDLKAIYKELDTVGFIQGAGSKERGRKLLKEAITKYSKLK